MARINKEQRSFIRTQFVEALVKRCNASIPKDLVGKKAEEKIVMTRSISIDMWDASRYHTYGPRIMSHHRRADKTTDSPVAKRMKAAVKAAEAIQVKGEKLWQEIERDMILGSDDIKKTLADTLAKVAKL